MALPRKVKYGITIPHRDSTLRNRAQRIRKSEVRQTLLMFSNCQRVEDALLGIAKQAGKSKEVVSVPCGLLRSPKDRCPDT